MGATVVLETDGEGEVSQAASTLVEELLDTEGAAPARRLSPGMRTAKLLEVGARCRVAVPGRELEADVDPSVHPVVLEGCLARGERVVVEVDEEGAVVVMGVLRTQPTPGVDAAEHYRIEAQRVEIVGGEEVSLSAKSALIALRAIGEVEAVAERITSRAHGVHKIIGRMLRLN